MNQTLIRDRLWLQAYGTALVSMRARVTSEYF